MAKIKFRHRKSNVQLILSEKELETFNPDVLKNYKQIGIVEEIKSEKVALKKVTKSKNIDARK